MRSAQNSVDLLSCRQNYSHGGHYLNRFTELFVVPGTAPTKINYEPYLTFCDLLQNVITTLNQDPYYKTVIWCRRVDDVTTIIIIIIID